jgi:formylglycine-generating enzyme required for sulfatase activity
MLKKLILKYMKTREYCVYLILVIMFSCSKDENLAPDPLGMEWVKVEGGAFVIGSIPGKSNVEGNAHKVELSDYFIGKFEVTNDQFATFLNDYKSDTIKQGIYAGKTIALSHEWGMSKGDSGWRPMKGYENHPAINISWVGANEFCKFYGWRLPTEAEWEFAARGGNLSKGYIYSGSDSMASIGWCSPTVENASGLHPHQVGTKNPNELGTYDMSGNAWEWVNDYDAPYDTSSHNNPIGPTSGKYHVLRGGCWLSVIANCASIIRNSDAHDFHGIMHNGFRCAK